MEELYKKVRFKNILYATDFSSASHVALGYALPLARKYGSRIFVAHVVSPALALAVSPAHTPAGVTETDREIMQSMAQLEPQLKEFPHEFIIRKGDIWKEIAAIIEEKAISLVVIGTHGRSGATKVIMGSVAEELFRKSPCPVLSVGPNVCGEPETLTEMRTILCPIDFRPESLAAIPYATSLAEQNQARLYLLYVAGGAVDELPDASLKAALRALIPSEAELWCEPKALIESGAPADKIVELAAELGVDVIVLAVKSAEQLATKPPHIALETAYKVVTKSICPVLTVRRRPSSVRNSRGEKS
jgi:nucleotide-binding universal stress UspA family protein